MVNPHVYMLREGTAPVPQVPLPAGYRFRTYQPERRGPNDEALDDFTWTTVQRRSEPFLTIGDDLFEKQFGDRREALAERMFFVETLSGEAIGTISAWWKPDWRDSRNWGQIHWVAVVPEHQGKGLSKPMMTHAMNCLLAHHARTMLGTSTGRVYAIKVYLDYGFTPAPDELADAEKLQGWHELQAILNHPLLKALPASKMTSGI